MTKRVYVDTRGVDDDAVRLGFSWLVSEAKTAGEARAVLAVSQLSLVESLGRALGAGAAASLRKARRVVADSVTVELAIERDARLAADAATLAVWPSARLLERLEEAGPRALCVVPWTEPDVADWLANWGPHELRTGKPAPRAAVSNPVVEAALESLTELVNLSTGLGHPSDHAAAVDMFRILQAGGEGWDPAEVRSWAANNRWGGKGAKELEQVAKAVREGRRIRAASRPVWADDILERWRSPGGRSIER